MKSIREDIWDIHLHKPKRTQVKVKQNTSKCIWKTLSHNISYDLNNVFFLNILEIIQFNKYNMTQKTKQNIENQI